MKPHEDLQGPTPCPISASSWGWLAQKASALSTGSHPQDDLQPQKPSTCKLNSAPGREENIALVDCPLAQHLVKSLFTFKGMSFATVDVPGGRITSD